MVSPETNNDKTRHPKGRLRFSLRTWLVVLTLICLGMHFGIRARQRNELAKKIVSHGTLTYSGNSKHEKPKRAMSSSRGTAIIHPAPRIELRDGVAPWISRWSEGSAIFCPFDSIEYHVSNVPVPDFVNEILATGELRYISLRVNNPSIRLNLVMRSSGLKELKLMGQTDDPHVLRGIHRLRDLETLHLYGLDLSYDQVLPHGLPPNLVTLYMPDCGLDADDVEIVRNCRKLESLSWRHGRFNLQRLADVGLPGSLRQADFFDSRVVKNDLPLLAECHHLRQLNLGNCDIDLRDIEGMDLPVSIVHLNLRGATLDASTFRWLSRLTNLQSLDLGGCKFADADAKEIVLSSSLKDFSGDGTHAGRHVAAMLAQASNLTTLNLEHTAIQDESLAALGRMSQLMELRLAGNRITDESANWIGNLMNLRRLGLSETDITDRFFELAPRLQEIGDLRVNNSNVSRELQDAIMKSTREGWQTEHDRSRLVPR